MNLIQVIVGVAEVVAVSPIIVATLIFETNSIVIMVVVENNNSSRDNTSNITSSTHSKTSNIE